MPEICVVTEPCWDCKYTDCVTQCPADCFYQDEKMLYIHPEECIGCDACIEECPVLAIFSLPQVPAQWQHYVQVNAERSAAIQGAGNEPLTTKQDAREGPECKK